MEALIREGPGTVEELFNGNPSFYNLDQNGEFEISVFLIFCLVKVKPCVVICYAYLVN